jgi:UDP-glucuronate 4-epimerase
MKILVTGCAGFIGSHVCEKLLKRGEKVIGIDNINNYYDIHKKMKNLEVLDKYENFSFYLEDIRTTKLVEELRPDKIIHLASMAGVRYSIKNPQLYVGVNVNGFINILEQAREIGIKQIVYASSSSVYGLNKKVPFSESDPIVTPNSPYACSKIAMELYAKTYNQLYDLNLIGLRFFTVYGPRGRPDMAPYKFLNAIKDGIQFQKYGDGTSSRDYTYIDDIVNGVIAACDNKKKIKCEVYNLGNSSPVSLNEFINLCEDVSGKKANYEQIENQLGDVPHTYADISKAQRDLDYQPQISLKEGLKRMFNSL